jgi:hypothetical protein
MIEKKFEVGKYKFTVQDDRVYFTWTQKLVIGKQVTTISFSHDDMRDLAEAALIAKEAL